MSIKSEITLNPNHVQPPTRTADSSASPPASLPEANISKTAPVGQGGENARIYFIGTATTVFEWNGIRVLTDPNFLHAGDHVHLGPGVQGTRRTNPAVDLAELPHIDAILLSHYHADHFDQEVEASLRRDLPIITTPHAKEHLGSKGPGEEFTEIHALEHFESTIMKIQGHPGAGIKVTATPGKHVPPGPAGMMAKVNDLLGAVPPTNGWMVELGAMTDAHDSTSFKSGYRVYISGDTLLVDELKEIPERYKGQNIDLMLIHLGGTTIPGPNMPLLMVTMDAKQGLELVRLINPDVTIPIHYDDYDVFMSPLSDFKAEVDKAGLTNKVVYLDRGDEYRFAVKQ